MCDRAVPEILYRATMITADAEQGAVVSLGTTIELERPSHAVRHARLVASAHGVYEASINGVPVSDAVLNPGWTSFEWRLAWQEHDVTSLISMGPNQVEIDVRLGNGWYRGGFGPTGSLNYGADLGLIAALEVEFSDGHRQVTRSAPGWRGRTSDTTENSLYNGQRIDARLRGKEKPLEVRSISFDPGVLVPDTGPAVRRKEILAPLLLWDSPSGNTIIDFGQNMVGWVRFTVSGPAGTEIVIRHAEALEGGELATAALRGAQATDRFVLSGGSDFFEPTFTFHGFRYIEVQGWPEPLTRESLHAVVVGSDLRATSHFECSDLRVNQLVHNSRWGQKGNFLAIPTDCPQRDERLGWTGDIAVFAPTAAFQFDVADFLDRWLQDVAAEQAHAPHHWVPWIVPDLLKYQGFPDWNQLSAIWGDATVWVPEALWGAYGDLDRLTTHYPAMATYLEGVERLLSDTGLWDTGYQFGDWLDPDAPADDPQQAKADPGVIATACLYRSAHFVAVAAQALGNGDHERWLALAERTKSAFQRHYVDRGIVKSDCATVYALALHFDLVEGVDRSRAAARLAQLVEENDFRATTGFAGTPYVTWALSENGYVDHAYRLLLNDACPSWLYQVSMGATTMWERWDSVLPDGRLNAPSMTSLNHYALGAICDWIYQVVAGVRAAEPGFRRIRLQPRPGPGIDRVRFSYDSVVGPIALEWSHDAGVFRLDAQTPDGIPTEVVLPDGQSFCITGGRTTWSCPWSPHETGCE